MPTNASSPDFTNILAGIGISNASPGDIQVALSNSNAQIAAQAVSETLSFPTAGPVGPPYFPPGTPHCPDPAKKYAFGGRDIVFVHGLQLDHLAAKIAGNPRASANWVTPTQFPGSLQNPEFYDGGYFKGVAEDVWQKHILKFLLDNGYQNRYLIVDYPCTERLEVGAQAVLTQISDAMHFGTGVKYIEDLYNPNGARDTSGFGTPSFVVVSHSTGTILTDVAMTAASQYANLNAGYIPRMCKAQVALDGVFSGSELATAAIEISGYVTIGTPVPWACALATSTLSLFDPNLPSWDCDFFGVFASSVLVDLVPLVAQYKWGSFVDQTPVRTLTVVGGHPTFIWPIKYIISPGFDDGVTTINSQVANPNSRFLWPSGFRPQGLGYVGPFDMGLAGTGNGQQSGLNSPARAIGYYIDQVSEFPRVPPFLIAGGAIPYLSPSGMRQDVADDYLNGPFNHFSTLNRYHNHFSFLQTASDHLGGYTGTLGFYGEDYFPTPFGEANQEESRVITDPTVYQAFAMVYPGDDAPLLDPNCVPKVETWERGRKIPAIHFSFFGHHFTWGPWWIWRRVYDLLQGWQTKMGCDYVYESVLQCPPLAPCSTCLAPPANLALWLPFDELAGSTTRNLAIGFDGALYDGGAVAGATNGPARVISDPTHISSNDGHNGGCLLFDGADDSVVVPSYPGINVGAGDFSLGAWVTRDPASGGSPTRIIFDKRDPGSNIGYSFAVSSDRLLLQLSDGAGTPGYANYVDTVGVPADGHWHFVAVTVGRGSATGIRFYVDGNPGAVLDPTAHSQSLDNTSPFIVGNSAAPGASPWMGAIDEAVVFTRALAGPEIQLIFAAGSTGMCKIPDVSSLTLNCATNKTVECGSAWSFDPPVAGGTCGGGVTVMVLQTSTNGAACSQIITRVWLATDACGNSNTCSQTVAVVDTTPPVLTVAPNKTVQCGSPWSFDIPAASDNCGVPAVSILGTVTNSGPCPTVISMYWQAIDSCGNTATGSQTVTVENTRPPLIQCPADIVIVSSNHVTVAYTVAATNACCQDVTVVLNPPSGSLFAPGTTNIVSCVATDCCKNSASCQFTVTVLAPQVPCPNLVVNGGFEITSPPMAPDSFNNTLDPTNGVPGWTTDSTNFLEVWSGNIGIPASEGTNQLEINAQSDDETVSQVLNGLSTNCVATFCFDYTGRFGLVDGTPNNDFTVTIESGGVALAASLDPAAYSVGGWQTYCANFIPADSTVTISFHGQPHFTDGAPATQGGAHIDNVSLTQCCPANPCITLTCAPDKTVAAGSKWAFDLPANIVDTCCSNIHLGFSAATNGVCPQIVTCVWLVTDDCGNSNTCAQTVTVVNPTPPALVCADDKTAGATAVWDFDAPTVSDSACGTNVSLVVTSTETNALGCGASITRIWTATDCCGNSATCAQTVTVAGGPPASCAIPSIAVFSAGGTNDDFTGSDPGLPSAGLLLRLHAAGVVSLKGFDDCGVGTFFAHTFTDLPPCVIAATLRIRVRACGANCSNDSFGLSFTAPSGAVPVPGWGRYLGNGNTGGPGLFNTPWSSSTTREITLDLSALPNADGSTTDLIPELNASGLLDLVLQNDSAIDFAVLTVTSCCCHQDIVVNTAGDECCAAVKYDPPQFTSQCGTLLVDCDPPSGSCFPVGTNLVQCQAIDDLGQVARCFFKVIVRDTVAPVIVNCPTNIVACEGSKIGAGVMPDMTSAVVATDNCTPSSQLTITQDPPPGASVTAGTVTFTVADASGNATSCSRTFHVLPCCVPPPNGLALWLTFDEGAGLVAYNSVGGNDGILMNGVARDSTGYVNQSLSFDGVDDSVSVPSYGGVNPGAGNLTIDAWVRRDPASDNSPRIIVDKRDPATTIGYSLAVSQGNLLFQMGSPANNYTNYRDTNTIPADGQWHFVAVTVNRATTNGGQFYLDGNPGAVFDPTLHPGSLDNTTPFVVGNSGVPEANPWLGGIDEVEMFRRVMKPAELGALFNARAAGKCRPSATLPAITSICGHPASVVVSAEICNVSPVAQTYNYYFQGLAPGPGANWPGPTVFSPSLGAVTVAANSCTNFPVTIGTPPAMKCGATAGYQMVIISAGSGDRFACEGSLYQACTLCAFPATNILVQGVQLPGLAVFNLSNTSTQAVDLTGLRISVRGFDQSPDMTYVSLDGQMPGMPWTASPGSTIPAGGQIEISVTAEFLDYSPGLPYELLLEFDADGDGDMEPIASVELSNVIAPTASVLAFSRGSDGSIALEWTRSGWTLQQAGNLSGVWSDLPGATSPYTIAPVQGAAMFYRLILRP